MNNKIPLEETGTLPRSQFSTENLRTNGDMSSKAIEAAWTYALSFLRAEKIDDPALISRLKPFPEINGQIDVVPFPGFMSIHVSGSPQKLNRTAADVAEDGLDGLLVQYVKKGQVFSASTFGFKSAEGGDIYLVDLTREATVNVSVFDTYNLLIPRGLFKDTDIEADVEAGALHMRKLSGDTAIAEILGRHIFDLHKRADSMTFSEAEAVTEPTLALLRAAIASSKENIDQSSPMAIHSHLAEIRKFIDNNLTNSNLEPEQIAMHLGVSRSKLYRLAEPLGGIQRFIKTRRLQHAFVALAKEGNTRGSISVVAFEVGFASENTFRRAFKDYFGMTPKEARTQGQMAQTAYLANVDVDEVPPEFAIPYPLYKRWTKDLFH